MNKHNTAITAKKQRRQLAAKARRARRKLKLSLLVNAKLRPILAKFGQAQAEVNRLQSEINQIRAGIAPAVVAEEVNEPT